MGPGVHLSISAPELRTGYRTGPETGSRTMPGSERTVQTELFTEYTRAKPRTASCETLTAVDVWKMMEAGANTFRLKANVTSAIKHRVLKMIHDAEVYMREKYKIKHRPATTCFTLKTCLSLTGFLRGNIEKTYIAVGSEVELTNDTNFCDKCDASKIYTDYPLIGRHVNVGMEITLHLFDEIIMRCIECLSDEAVVCEVTHGGYLVSMSNLTVRESTNLLPLLTKQDIEMIGFVKEYDVDMLMIYYVRCAETVKRVRQLLGKNSKLIVLAGICTQQALDNIEEIINEADGIVFAREFLYKEVKPEYVLKLGQIQKLITGLCQKIGKPFYLSGEVMISTLTTGILRAHDVADVSNALLDGTTGLVLRDYRDIDCVVKTLRSLNSICKMVEKFSTQKIDIWRLYDEYALPVNAAEACVLGCTLAAMQVNAKAIVLPIVSGNTLKALIRLRPACVLVTVCTNNNVAMFLHLYRGVIPLTYTEEKKENFYEAMNSRILYAVNYAISKSILVYGDNYVTLQRGSPTSPYCDCVRIETVTISKKVLVECDE